MVTLVIPTSCECENIGRLLGRLAAVRSSLGERLEVLVVDSGSEDGTVTRARDVLSREQLGRVIEQPSGCSLAQAVREGIRQAMGELIGVMDADLSHPPELLPALVGVVRSGHEVAIASRYVAGAVALNWPWRRRVLSRLGNLLARPLVPAADATSGYFVCQAQLVKSLALETQGFKILLEILVKGCVHHVQELPYTFTDRVRGSSKLTGRELWRYLSQLARLYRFRFAHINFAARHVSETKFL